MKSSRLILPNQAKKLEYLILKQPTMLRRRMKPTMGTNARYEWISLQFSLGPHEEANTEKAAKATRLVEAMAHVMLRGHKLPEWLSSKSFRRWHTATTNAKQKP